MIRMSNQQTRKILRDLVDALVMVLAQSLDAQDEAGLDTKNQREKAIQLVNSIARTIQQIPD
jgi:hypothetical protein